jgi:hypothetical protein
MIIDCKHVWNYISEYLDGALPHETKDTVQKHLDHCEICSAIRDHLHLGPGDQIKFFVHPDGSVRVLATNPRRASLKGIVRTRRRVSLDVRTSPSREVRLPAISKLNGGGRTRCQCPHRLSRSRRRYSIAPRDSYH